MADLLITLLQEEEGCVLTARPDSKGYWEIGWGHDLPINAEGYAGLVWTQAQADLVLSQDATLARGRAVILPGYARCNEVRQAVLGSMCYQLGTLANWSHFKGAMAIDDYALAAYHGLDSPPWITETPKRAFREMVMLATGNWLNKQ